MKKKLLSLLFAAIMVFTMIPTVSFASDTDTVYLSVSDDRQYVTDAAGNPIAYIEVTLDKLASIDLTSYELGDYVYDADNDGTPEITALHLYIYVHEKILGLDWSDVIVTGSPGSIYLAGGLFGFYDENLRYDLNGAYPAVDGWGLTADRIVLSDGDFLNVAHYTSWAFWGDSATGFHYFTNAEGNLEHIYNLTVGDELELGLVRSYSDWTNGGAPAFAGEPNYEVFYGTTYGEPAGRIMTDDSGFLNISFPSAGTWYVWADGGYGMENRTDVVSAPALATVNVKGEPELILNVDLTEYTGTLADALILSLDMADENNVFIDDNFVSGQKSTYSFYSGDYDQYIIDICMNENDDSIVGWNVNGTDYLMSDAMDREYNCWDLDNDVCIGYNFDVGDNSDLTEFYVILGVYDCDFNTSGTWNIKPILKTAAEPIDVYVSIANKGEVVMAKNKITVIDLDENGDFDVDEVLYAAHEYAYAGGAAAGYGTAVGDYGLYITNLWGDTSENYGYWLNDASCWSLGDTVEANDSLVAFVYQNTESWDSYSKFSQGSYTGRAEAATTVTLDKAGYDEDWNTVFSSHKGAILRVYDADFTELSSGTYKVTDNGDGTYSVTVKTIGAYLLVAYDNTTPIVPSICTLSVTENADLVGVNAVEEKINSIGTVTAGSKTAIDEARAAYNALTDEQKTLVENYDVLTAAEAMLSGITADIEAADAVEEKINAIGTVTIHSWNKIKTARTAYNALTDSQNAYVENIDILTDAESAIDLLYAEAADADHKAIYEATSTYLSGLGVPSVGSTGGEWMVIDLTRAGFACPDGYYENVVAFIRENINDKEQLHRAKSTENSRVILALTSAGYDVTDVDGHNLLMGLTDMTYVKKQGINGPIWALIAFDCYDYEIPVNANATEQVTRENLIAYILEKQLEDGGWALSGTATDPDMTGMAIQSLAPYYITNTEVKAAVDEALVCLTNKQYDNGGFGSIDGACSESCAQVITALTALGINPETDSRFVKNGVSVVDAMCLFAADGGGFAHTPGGGLNGMATEQSQYALAAYFRFLDGKTSLYDMSDVTIRKKDVETKVDIVEGGITAVPDSLKEVGLETPEKVEDELVQAIVSANDKVDTDNIIHYDVTLMYTEDDGNTWIKADDSHFPADGKLTVTIPYPDGTDSSYTFTVAHMFTSNAFGKTPGEIEIPTVTNTENGIQFQVTGLSPISVYWTKATSGDSVQDNNGENSGNDLGSNDSGNTGIGSESGIPGSSAVDSADTGDHSSVILWIMVMLISAAGTMAVMKEKKKVR